MRYEITRLEGNKIMVTDTVSGSRFYGSVNVKGYAVADSALSLAILSKALRQNC